MQVRPLAHGFRKRAAITCIALAVTVIIRRTMRCALGNKHRDFTWNMAEVRLFSSRCRARAHSVSGSRALVCESKESFKRKPMANYGKHRKRPILEVSGFVTSFRQREFLPRALFCAH